MAVYPRKRARTALKLRQNAFQNIPVISFFDEKIKNRRKKKKIVEQKKSLKTTKKKNVFFLGGGYFFCGWSDWDYILPIPNFTLCTPG